MKIEIDQHSGFCFGVVKAIEKAEEQLKMGKQLFCLGDIVHNKEEVNRLQHMGMQTINYDQYKELKNSTVLIRAHGEPPATYEIAEQNNIELVDASCPVVLKLQSRIKSSYQELSTLKGQIVIYGKKGHAEVNGLEGQINNDSIVIGSIDELDKIDYSRPVSLYTQTTMDIDDFYQLQAELLQRMQTVQKRDDVQLKVNDTICRQVANRAPLVREFSEKYEVILFVSGKESSNGKVLYNTAKSVNKNTHFVSNISDLDPVWFINIESVGICGATSTPNWLMEKVAEQVNTIDTIVNKVS